MRATLILIALFALATTAFAGAKRQKRTPQEVPPPHLKPEGVQRAGCEGALDKINEDDIDRIITNQNLYRFYKACILGDNPATVKCTCSGWELRRIMSGLLNPSLCPGNIKRPYCPTPDQRRRGQDFMKRLSKVDNDTWKEVLRKYSGKGSN